MTSDKISAAVSALNRERNTLSKSWLPHYEESAAEARRMLNQAEANIQDAKLAIREIDEAINVLAEGA